MEVLNLTTEDLQNLSSYPIDLDISNHESQIFYFNSDWAKEPLLLKYLYNPSKEILTNKIFTLQMLEKYAYDAGLDEFVIPEYFVSVNDSIAGFLIPEMRNTTSLGTLLKSQKLSKQEKLELVIRVGSLIEKTKVLDKMGHPFYFSDLHEDNFLIDNDTQELFVIDLDSASFRSDIALSSYYLVDNPNLSNLSKYSFNVFGIPYPSHDSDLLCYNMMLLNVLAEENMNLISIDEYYSYLDYIQEIGFSKSFVDSFRSIYTENSNVNASLSFDNVSDEVLSISSFSHMKANKKNK